MSKETFDDDCPGCKPVAIDPKTMEAMPKDSPIMQAIDRVWAASTRAEREAFHRFTCLNSRDPGDVLAMHALTKRIEVAAHQADN